MRPAEIAAVEAFAAETDGAGLGCSKLATAAVLALPAVRGSRAAGPAVQGIDPVVPTVASVVIDDAVSIVVVLQLVVLA